LVINFFYANVFQKIQRSDHYPACRHYPGAAAYSLYRYTCSKDQPADAANGASFDLKFLLCKRNKVHTNTTQLLKLNNMKQKPLTGFTSLIFFSNTAIAQNAGISVDSPTAKLHVNGVLKLQFGLSIGDISR
jgi:hypothetical protein